MIFPVSEMLKQFFHKLTNTLTKKENNATFDKTNSKNVSLCLNASIAVCVSLGGKIYQNKSFS